jgi:hypothetical protein
MDFDLRFTYVLARWKGSAHDSFVLQDALSCPSDLKIPDGSRHDTQLILFWLVKRLANFS